MLTIVETFDLHPWLVPVVAPLVIAVALLLASLPRRIANWRMRRAQLALEIANLTTRAEREHATIAKARVERIRQLDEQRRVAGVLSPGLRAASLAKIEPDFRRRHEDTELERDHDVRSRQRLLNASRFTKLFADECQRR